MTNLSTAVILVNNHLVDIRQANHENWLIEGRDRLNAMEEFPALAMDIFAELEQRAAVHRVTDQSRLYPCLWKRPGEDHWKWLDRCVEIDRQWSKGFAPVVSSGSVFPEELKSKRMKELERMQNEPMDSEKETINVLTILQPYAYYIIHGWGKAGFKDIENRCWSSNYRGRLYIHAGKEWYDAPMPWDPGDKFQEMDEQRGKIIGYVDMVDCVSSSNSTWFSGPYGFVLQNPVALETQIKISGRQRIWAARVKVTA